MVKEQIAENIINACFKMFEAWAAGEFEARDRAMNAIFGMLRKYDSERRTEAWERAMKSVRKE